MNPRTISLNKLEFILRRKAALWFAILLSTIRWAISEEDTHKHLNSNGVIEEVITLSPSFYEPEDLVSGQENFRLSIKGKSFPLTFVDSDMAVEDKTRIVADLNFLYQGATSDVLIQLLEGSKKVPWLQITGTARKVPPEVYSEFGRVTMNDGHTELLISRKLSGAYAKHFAEINQFKTEIDKLRELCDQLSKLDLKTLDANLSDRILSTIPSDGMTAEEKLTFLTDSLDSGILGPTVFDIGRVDNPKIVQVGARLSVKVSEKSSYFTIVFVFEDGLWRLLVP